MAEGRTLTPEQTKSIKDLVNSLFEEEGILGVVVVDETGLPICSSGNIIISDSENMTIRYSIIL
ncbi:MAG: hypothetical protein ACTSSP_09140 [Candidatus Asgardarchaeia archaeon]